MKTVEWKGIRLTVIPLEKPVCAVMANGQLIWCAMSDKHSTDCNCMCPSGSTMLLEGDDLAKYLAAKLTGDVK